MIVRLPIMLKTEDNSLNNTKFVIKNQEFKLNNEEVVCNLEIECNSLKNNAPKIRVISELVYNFVRNKKISKLRT